MMDRIVESNMVDEFVTYLMMEERSELTIGKYKHDVNIFIEYANGQIITKELVIRYKEALLEKYKYAVSSANSMLAALCKFLKFMQWEDCCVKQYKLQKKAYCAVDKELNKQEYKRLLKIAKNVGNTQMYLILQILCSTGMRASELQCLTVEALQDHQVTVTCKGKTRIVYIPKKVWKQLKKYVEESGIKSGPIFLTRNNKPRSRHSIWKEMKKLGKMAGIPLSKIFPHNLRHLFARTFYAQEKDIATLADILGHSSIETTRIYLITTKAEHAKKIERMQLTD